MSAVRLDTIGVGRRTTRRSLPRKDTRALAGDDRPVALLPAGLQGDLTRLRHSDRGVWGRRLAATPAPKRSGGEKAAEGSGPAAAPHALEGVEKVLTSPLPADRAIARA